VRPEPIVILAMPRSGSSMTAGLFQAHGAWFGTCRPGDADNPKGHFENNAIKREMIRRWGSLTLARGVTSFDQNPVCAPQDGFRSCVERILDTDGYTGGPWGYKQSALYKPAWHEFNPYFVGVKRENVLKANTSRQAMFGTRDPKRVQRMIDLHHAVIDECEVIVRTDEIIHGNLRSLDDALAYCGLTIDVSAVDDFVDPSLWHY